MVALLRRSGALVERYAWLCERSAVELGAARAADTKITQKWLKTKKILIWAGNRTFFDQFPIGQIFDLEVTHSGGPLRVREGGQKLIRFGILIFAFVALAAPSSTALRSHSHA